MKKSFTASEITILGLMLGLLLLMAYTPLGYLNIGPLAITLNMIPVAISALALGKMGGTIAGLIFGLTSVGQCIGIGGTSAMGAMLFSINPVLAILQRLLPRLAMGFLVAVIFQKLRSAKLSRTVSCSVAGFFAAFLNTLFFMTLLVLFFGNTTYMQELIAGRNVLVFICAFVGINAVVEIVVSTLVTGVVGEALFRAGLIKEDIG